MTRTVQSPVPTIAKIGHSFNCNDEYSDNGNDKNKRKDTTSNDTCDNNTNNDTDNDENNEKPKFLSYLNLTLKIGQRVTYMQAYKKRLTEHSL